jgi:hypothetical protein
VVPFEAGVSAADHLPDLGVMLNKSCDFRDRAEQGMASKDRLEHFKLLDDQDEHVH